MRVVKIWNVMQIVAIAFVLMNTEVRAASFLDDFSSDTSANYHGTNTYGSGGTFDISSGTLNVDPGNNNTYDVFHKTARLAVGEYVSIDIPSSDPRNFWLDVSTTNRGPNITGVHGIRYAVNGTSFQAKTYLNGGLSGTHTFTSSDVSGKDLTLYIYRDTEKNYRFGYDAHDGEGIQLLKRIELSLTVGVTGLYVGVEAYEDTARHFDNLEIADIPEVPAVGAFFDDFSVDSSVDYIGTTAAGSGGNWNISSGTLNVDPNGYATYNVFLDSARLAVNEHVRVDIPSTDPRSFYLTVSTTNRNPAIAGADGIRLAVQGGPNFRVRHYVNGTVTVNDSYSTSDAAENLTLYIYRDTETEYRVGYDTGSGVQILGGVRTISQTAGKAGLYVGVEVYDTVLCHFDNLEIVIIPKGTMIIIH